MDERIPGDSDTRHTHDASKPITAHARRKVVSIVDAIQARKYDNQQLGFTHEELIRFGLPVRKPKGQLWTCADAKFSLEMRTDDMTVGLPYGDDLLILLWITSAYVQLGCPENRWISFRSAGDILRTYNPNLGKLSGKHRLLLRARFERLWHTSYYVQPREITPERMKAAKYGFFDQFDLWFTDPKRRRGLNQHTLAQITIWPSWIQLSERYATMIRENRRPFDFNTVTALRGRPVAVRLYLWLAYKSFLALSRPQREVPLFSTPQQLGLAEQLGMEGHDGERTRVRQELGEALQAIKEVWPDCRSSIDQDRLWIEAARAVGENASPLLRVGRTRSENEPPMLVDRSLEPSSRLVLRPPE